MRKTNLLYLAFAYSICNAGYIPQSAINMANRPAQNFYYGGSEKYQFKGYLKTKNKVLFTSGIYKDSGEKAFVRLDDDKLFDFSKDDTLKKYPEDFDSLKAFTVTAFTVDNNNDTTWNDTTWHPAIARDSEWIFNGIKGKISLFTSVPSGSYTYMSFNDNSLVNYDEDAVRLKLSENKEAESLLQAKTNWTVTSILLAVTGVVVMGIGLVNSDKEVWDEYGHTTHEFDPSPLILVGGGILLSSWIPYIIVKDNYTKAIYKYNF